MPSYGYQYRRETSDRLFWRIKEFKARIEALPESLDGAMQPEGKQYPNPDRQRDWFQNEINVMEEILETRTNHEDMH